jgi:S1-C subfamily serine protease
MSVIRGIVGSLRTFDGSRHVLSDAAINPGNSGGPMVTEYCRAVGAGTFEHRDSEAMGLSVAAEEAAKLFPGQASLEH